MNSNKEIYSGLKFTVVCQSHSCCSVCSPAMVLVKGRMLSEVLKGFKLQGHQLCIVDPKLWTITRSSYCLYKRCVPLDTAHGLLR
jgi:hypothetical protein